MEKHPKVFFRTPIPNQKRVHHTSYLGISNISFGVLPNSKVQRRFIDKQSSHLGMEAPVDLFATGPARTTKSLRSGQISQRKTQQKYIVPSKSKRFRIFLKQATSNVSSNFFENHLKIPENSPRKSKSTKLCTLALSGILYMDHPKDDSLFGLGLLGEIYNVMYNSFIIILLMLQKSGDRNTMDA